MKVICTLDSRAKASVKLDFEIIAREINTRHLILSCISHLTSFSFLAKSFGQTENSRYTLSKSVCTKRFFLPLFLSFSPRIFARQLQTARVGIEDGRVKITGRTGTDQWQRPRGFVSSPDLSPSQFTGAVPLGEWHCVGDTQHDRVFPPFRWSGWI